MSNDIKKTTAWQRKKSFPIIPRSPEKRKKERNRKRERTRLNLISFVFFHPFNKTTNKFIGVSFLALSERTTGEPTYPTAVTLLFTTNNVTVTSKQVLKSHLLASFCQYTALIVSLITKRMHVRCRKQVSKNKPKENKNLSQAHCTEVSITNNLLDLNLCTFVPWFYKNEVIVCILVWKVVCVFTI